MNGLLSHLEPDYSEFVEVDPTGRYGRYNEILGKGASKTVYRAFDEYEGIEVAWNQVKLYDFLQSPEDLERLYCEIHLLKTLKHKNIMKFYTSWVDTANRNINFITEMFTSGTLRQYRQKHKRVNIRAVKHWCRQILRGLLYLHSHDPPVIHRDLKCDNIFVNGNQGEVKIGDLGLAAILRKSHAAHCVGTPEFMAPEVYEEEYNELVDIYSFGMCILEMVTFEYPYSECTHPAQIYKKVISGKKPDALYKVRDPEVRQFVEKCLATVSSRLSARDLLKDPFLQIDGCESDLRPRRDYDEMDPIIRQSFLEYHHTDNGSFSNNNGYSNGVEFEAHQNGWDYQPVESEPSGIDLFEYHDDEHSLNVDISIKGKRRDDDGIFLRLRIADKEGRIRNIYFPFDIDADTAFSVATEMVAELDITDQDVNQISDMIDEEIASLVPEWKPGPGIEETPRFANTSFCQNCVSNHTSCGSLMDYLSHNPGAAKNLEGLECSLHCCAAAMHGRFEEITYQVDDVSEHHVTEGAPVVSSHSENSHYNEIWDQHESDELSSVGSGENSSDGEEHEKLEDETVSAEEKREIPMENEAATDNARKPHSSNAINSLECAVSDDNDNKIQQKLRWLKAKSQMELEKLRDQQLRHVPNSSNSNCISENRVCSSPVLNATTTKEQGNINGNEEQQHCSSSGNNWDSRIEDEKRTSDSETQRVRNRESCKEDAKDMMMGNGKSLYFGSLLPLSIHRTTSLPVDAVDL